MSWTVLLLLLCGLPRSPSPSPSLPLPFSGAGQCLLTSFQLQVEVSIILRLSSPGPLTRLSPHTAPGSAHPLSHQSELKNQCLRLTLSFYEPHSSFPKCPPLLPGPAQQLSLKPSWRFLSICLSIPNTYKIFETSLEFLGPENILKGLNLTTGIQCIIRSRVVSGTLKSTRCLGTWDQRCPEAPDRKQPPPAGSSAAFLGLREYCCSSPLMLSFFTGAFGWFAITWRHRRGCVAGKQEIQITVFRCHLLPLSLSG